MKVRRIRENLLHISFDKAGEAQELVTCEECGLAFHATNTTEQALADFQRDFPGETEVSLVCDDCYEKFIAALKSSTLPN